MKRTATKIAIPIALLTLILVLIARPHNPTINIESTSDNYSIAIQPQFAWVGTFSDGLAVAAQDGAWGINLRHRHTPWRFGVIDTEGNWVVRPQFYGINPFSDGVAGVRFAIEDEGNWGVIDRQGNVIVPARYDFVDTFSEGMAVVGFRIPHENWMQASWLTGYINANGVEIVPPQFDRAMPFTNGLGVVFLDGMAGAVNREGELVIPLEFDWICVFVDGLAPARKNGRAGFIDTSGQWAFPLKFDSSDGFSEGLAAVLIDGLWGFIDTTGEMVIPPQFDQAARFSDGIARVMVNYSWGLIDTTGAFTVAPRFGPHFGNTPAHTGEDGAEYLPTTLDIAGDYRNGLVPLMEFVPVGPGSGTSGGWGAMDRYGRIVIPVIYDFIYYFDDGYVRVSQHMDRGVLHGIMDITGTMVVAPRFSLLGVPSEGLAAVEVYPENGGRPRWGFIRFHPSS